MAAHLPLTECTGTEIVVRTVYQIIKSDYRQNPEQYDNPTTRLLDLALQWRALGLDLIADTLQDAAEHVSARHTIASWKSLRTAMDVTRIMTLSSLGRARKRQPPY